MNERSLFDLLPAVYRVRDRAQGDPLRALLAVVDREVRRIEDDIAGLYDDWFIETCHEWVVPYIGDLLGVRRLLPLDDPSFTQRGYVANTLGYRRRKGTVAVLEQLARDLTGWPARAVEFFEHLVTTQHVNHVRPQAIATADLRSAYSLQYASTPFETLTHTAEVRHIDSGRGRYGIPNIGLFLWRLQSYPLTGVTARQVDAKRFTIDPLGADATLFGVPNAEAGPHHACRPGQRAVADLAPHAAPRPGPLLRGRRGPGECSDRSRRFRHPAGRGRCLRPLRHGRRLGARGAGRHGRARSATRADRVRRRARR